MLCAEVQSMRKFEEWLARERLRKAQEKAENQDLEKAAQAQVDRPRDRWCIGSGEIEENEGKCCTNRTHHEWHWCKSSRLQVTCGSIHLEAYRVLVLCGCSDNGRSETYVRETGRNRW